MADSNNPDNQKVHPDLCPFLKEEISVLHDE